MHPFRFALTRGPLVSRAPENDDGAEYDDPVDDVDPDLDPEPDADDEGEDPEPDDELPEDDLGEPEPPARQSRGENRVAAATRAAKEAKDHAARLEAEIAAMRQQQAQPRETPAQINERLSLMEPWERTEYFRQQDRAEMQAHLQRIEFQAQESADKTAYEALCSRKPIAAKLRDDVESRLADMRKAGTTAPRETVLRWVIGDRALANEGRATGKARKTADANRDRQTARPTAGRGDASRSDQRNNSASALEKRLENVQL